MDAFDRIMELSRQGLYCAQIMVQLALDAEGKENPDLIQGFLSMLGRELSADERIAMIGDFHAWFRERTEQYGGENCENIERGDPQNMVTTCPGVIIDSYEKCVALLEEKGLA